MLNYKLGKLASRRAGTSAPLPAIHGSVGTETAYLKALRVMLRSMASAVRDEVIPAVERDMAIKLVARGFTGDIDGSVFERIAQLGNALANVAHGTVMRILGLESQRHTKAFMATAKRTLGVDLQAVVRNDDLAEYLEAAATRNIGLIRGLSQLLTQRVQHTVTSHVIAGGTVPELRTKLRDDFGFADSRARLIARDQTAKFNSDLNRIRHKQAGIEKYTWRTSHDERVRPRHRKLDGNIYAYDEPTGAEQGLPPGQPVQCRCIAQAIVEF